MGVHINKRTYIYNLFCCLFVYLFIYSFFNGNARTQGSHATRMATVASLANVHVIMAFILRVVYATARNPLSGAAKVQ